MPSYAALLRAVNLGPHNQVSKEALKEASERCGFARARTYIASGNLLFDTDADEATVKARLETELAARMGKSVPVLIRTAAELATLRDANPFSDAPANRVVAILLDGDPPIDALTAARLVDGEQMALGPRAIFVRYTDTGMGKSKLVIPAAKSGTGRNMNTVAKLAELASS